MHADVYGKKGIRYRFCGCKVKITYFLILIFLLSSCATFSDLEKGLEDLTGRNDQVAFDVLGYPDKEKIISGDTVYIWYRSRSGQIVLPKTQTTTGQVGGVNYSQQTTTTQSYRYNNYCIIKLVAGPSDIITHWSYDGDLGGCRPYINSLKKFQEDPY